MKEPSQLKAEWWQELRGVVHQSPCQLEGSAHTSARGALPCMAPAPELARLGGALNHCSQDKEVEVWGGTGSVAQIGVLASPLDPSRPRSGLRMPVLSSPHFKLHQGNCLGMLVTQ